MYTTNISVRVRYGETDQMGVVYHGHYPSYLEVARIEFFRKIGIPYKDIEAKGYMLPVTELTIKYLHPAKYDELLKIHVSIDGIPSGPRLIFNYEIYNENEKLLTTASTTLVFINSENRLPTRCPKFIIDRFLTYFNESDSVK